MEWRSQGEATVLFKMHEKSFAWGMPPAYNCNLKSIHSQGSLLHYSNSLSDTFGIVGHMILCLEAFAYCQEGAVAYVELRMV